MGKNKRNKRRVSKAIQESNDNKELNTSSDNETDKNPFEEVKQPDISPIDPNQEEISPNTSNTSGE